MELLREFLNQDIVLIGWLSTSLLALVIVIRDLRKHNYFLGSLMKWVWALTVVYSGFAGLLIYYYSGRGQIPRDNIFRKGFRSVAHCYSGCGAGEIAGIIIAAGILSLDTWWVAGISFFLAYVAGFALTVGPLMQSGVSFNTAVKDAFYSETASITVMEVVAIGVDIYLAGDATMGEPLFWTSLLTSLTLGLLAAYPVNVLLIKWGVKEGMHNPKMMME